VVAGSTSGHSSRSLHPPSHRPFVSDAEGQPNATAQLFVPLSSTSGARGRCAGLRRVGSAAVDSLTGGDTLAHVAAISQHLDHVPGLLPVDRNETGELGIVGAAERSLVLLGYRRAPARRQGWRGRPTAGEQRAFETPR